MLNSRPLSVHAAVLVFILASPLSAKEVSVESKQQSQSELARVVDQLNALGAQFDADKNQELSRQEQEAMQKFVADKFGRAWAQRLKIFLNDADSNGDGRITLTEWNAAVERLRKRGLGTLAVKTVMVPMHDGKRLATDIYLPAGECPFPVIFLRTPYSRVKPGRDLGQGYTAAGVAVVAQDMRGRFDSEGENLPFIGCGWANIAMASIRSTGSASRPGATARSVRSAGRPAASHSASWPGPLRRDWPRNISSSPRPACMNRRATWAGPCGNARSKSGPARTGSTKGPSISRGPIPTTTTTGGNLIPARGSSG